MKVLHSICQQICKAQQWSQDWKKVSFHSNPKERECQRSSSPCSIALISQASKVMLKIIQCRIQQYMNHELPDVQAVFRKDRATRYQLPSICWIMEKATEFQKNTYVCFTDYSKAKRLTVWITKKQQKILKEK